MYTEKDFEDYIRSMDSNAVDTNKDTAISVFVNFKKYMEDKTQND